MPELIRAFIIMQETSLKINQDPETTIVVSAANGSCPSQESSCLRFREQNVTERVADCDLF